jgi:D-2-hydroxyacid dehydrogenase (NADP+)
LAVLKVLIIEYEFVEELSRIHLLLSRAFPQLEIHAASEYGKVTPSAEDASVLVGKTPFITQTLLDRLPALNWIQCATSGVDRLLRLRLPQELIVTTARGIHGPQMAEMAILHMLALSRGVGRLARQQSARIWQSVPQRTLYRKMVAILGVGTIAESLATRCAAFGMRVIGLTRRPGEIADFHELRQYSRLIETAAEADFLVVLCPLTEETRGIISSHVLAAMKPDGVLINLSRGACVDEAALLSALQHKKIGGAGLDAFQQEPLMPQHPLWSEPDAFITPHLGGSSEIFADQFSEILIANMKLFIAGRTEVMTNRIV